MATAISDRFPLHVWARRETSYEGLGAAPFTKHSNAAELASNVDILCLCLRGDQDLHDLLEASVLAALRPGSVLVNHATGDPEEARGFKALCDSKNIGFLDAPVSGGRSGAEARALTCFVGAEEDALASCMEVLRCHSTHVVHMGGAGSGQAAKLCNNALTVSNLRNAVEVFAVAEKLGLDGPKLQKALAHSSGGSFILNALGTKVSPSIAAHIARLNHTDVDEFTAAAQQQGCNVEALAAWAHGGADGLETLVRKLMSP